MRSLEVEVILGMSGDMELWASEDGLSENYAGLERWVLARQAAVTKGGMVSF